MALGAFQVSLNILIHYERFYNGVVMHLISISSFWAVTQKKLINLNLTSSCIFDIYEYFTTTSMSTQALKYFRRKVNNSWLAHVSKYNNINNVE
jgi:hypothetical protein